jgi:hypothetical protein
MSAEELAASAELIQNVGFLEDRLYNARIDMAEEPLVVAYDNGGGQQGVRKNPAYEVYTKLYSSYIAGVRTLLERLPVTMPVEIVADTSLQAKRDVIASLRQAEADRGGTSDGK